MTQPEQKPEPLVPIEDLAKHFAVSISTVRAWLRQGYIPKHTYIKLGNTYRFQLTKVIEALTQAHKEEEVPPTPVPLAQLELDFSNPDKDI